MKNILNIDNGIPTLLSNVDDGTNTLYINDELVPSSEWTGTGYYTFTSGGLTFTIQKIRDDSGNIMLQLIERSGGTSYRLIKYISNAEKYYSIDDPAETDLADGDYVPFYDTSAGAKKKTLWSNIKTVLGNIFAPLNHAHDYAGSSSPGGVANSSRTTSQYAKVGSDAENSNGWYKVCSGTLTGYNNTSLIFAIHNAKSAESGIFVVDLRCDNGASITINKFGWLVRNGYALTDFIINTNGNNWAIYQNITRIRYWRDFWVVLEESSTSGTPTNLYTLHSNVAKESTTPTATATSVDLGIVNTADKFSGFSSRSTSMGWGVQTGTVVTCFATSAGGGWGFRDNCPSSGKTSMVIDGNVYQNEGQYMCLDTNNYSSYALPLAGGTMTGASGIQYPTASGNNKTGNWISAGGGYGTGSGKSGVKIIACEQGDCISGLGQDCGGGPYELSIVTGAQPSNTNVAYIRFLKHTQNGTSYTKLGEIDGSGNYTAPGTVNSQNMLCNGWLRVRRQNTSDIGGIKITDNLYDKGTVTFYVSNYATNLIGSGANATVYLPTSSGTIALASSSRRIKKNIRAITEEEAQKLLDIDVVKFDYKEGWGDGKKNHAGFIAEDVQKIIPETVIVNKNYDPNLPIDVECNFPPEMDYQRFVPYLVKMVQMQQKEINELKAEIQLLKEGR